MLWILENFKGLRSVNFEMIRNLVIAVYVLAVLAICATVKASEKKELSPSQVVRTDMNIDLGINGASTAL